MNDLLLKAERRNIFGKKLYLLRSKGMVPAILYGPNEKPQPLSVSFLDFKRIWRKAGESTIINLDVEGELKEVLIYDIDFDPLKDEPRHIDFYLVERGRRLSAFVPLVFEGVAPAVKNLGGILVKVIHEIEVESLPKNLPREIKVDISSLKSFEDKITVADLKLPEGVEAVLDPEEVVALVEEPKDEKEGESEEFDEASLKKIEAIKEKSEEEKASKKEEENK